MINLKKIAIIVAGLIFTFSLSFGQTSPFDNVGFILGEWKGAGSGFGNEKSSIESCFHLIMDGKYIEVKNESNFEPTEQKPDGEYHIDKGFVSYDESRKLLVYRQFNNEGYVNQYVLNDSLSNASLLIFETETIENFIPGGKARWTIKKISNAEIETTFDVLFPGKEYTCFGVTKLTRK